MPRDASPSAMLEEDRTRGASALRHPVPVDPMLVALADRTGCVPGSLDALDPLTDFAGGRTERIAADLAVRHAGAQRAEIGCGLVQRQTEVERLVLQPCEIRRDL